MDLFEIAGSLGIITSILAFCNNAALASVCKYAMYAFWGISLVLILLKGRFRLRPIMFIMLLVYGIMFAAGRFFYSVGLYQSSGPGPAMCLPYCVLFYFIGYNCQNDRRRDAGIFIKAYLFAHIVFVVLKLIFIRQAAENYSGKNLSAQIIGMGIILALFVLPMFEQRKWLLWVFRLFAIFSFFVLIQMHSRTPALAVLLTTVYWLFSQKAKKQYYLIALLMIGFSIYYFTTEGGSNFLFDYLQGDKSQDELTWSVVTSGRTDLYAEVVREIIQHPLIGQGAWAYLDSFPIHVLRTGGLLAAALIFPVAYGGIFRYVRADFREGHQHENGQRDSVLRLTGLICVYYFVVSLFEGYPPLGPNLSAFMLWIMIGLADRHRDDMSDALVLPEKESSITV